MYVIGSLNMVSIKEEHERQVIADSILRLFVGLEGSTDLIANLAIKLIDTRNRHS